MEADFETALQLVLVHEGGFSNHPQDPGGATMKGVTLQVFQSYFGADKTVDDLKNISQAQLEQIYRSGYWDKCSGDALPAGLDYAMFDFAVNSGPGRAVKFLQKILGAQQDGAMGPATLSLVAAANPADMINQLCDARQAYLESLSTFATFGAGWSKRVRDVRQQALDMLGGNAPASQAAPSLVTVRLGSSGDSVRALQSALGIAVDGQFGPQTEAALKEYQASHGLTADGIAGRNTWRALGLMA
ncbi:glycosyl hydrolase 108 family protein [Massilia sp. W12]|uniref:glycosyl hydrolase 108 family protein n=1 Tax=Massilia sp. W12 TaxID=3126507 RepID=UPI0030D40133